MAIGGPHTQAAVTSFQQQHGLAADGIVGPKTAHALANQGAAKATGATPTPPPAGTRLHLHDQLSTIDSPISRAIGYAEGNRTAGGEKTAHYNHHPDPVNHERNVGNFSKQHRTANAAEADQMQLAKLRAAIPMYQEACQRAHLDSSHPLLAATFFDLYNQSEKAATARGSNCLFASAAIISQAAV